MRYFFDTSALVRYYHFEPGTPRVESIFREPGASHLISWLGVLETQSAFAFKVRVGEFGEGDFANLRKKLKTDIGLRRLLVVRVLRPHFDRAAQLLAKYGLQRRLRSLDALQLGTALDLHSRGKIDFLVTADSTLCEAAQREGIPVQNPLAS